ncbi:MULTISPECIES: phosphogluconate dehydrogenase (NAD(+)-dependent, decarboxylating) [Rhodococcus]|uniref:Decarboxylating 6-phosphogluconate dehydrogenase n=1 Tax=Rhodococcus opacus TaxID=37919 RepID=A0AAX3YQD0_RHOOP|nr:MULTISPECIES: decarboxylating 6-phosphogluconate dehydrogenase [Rhodococcus]NHU41779.1 decarboxylating 6-phosphogluconate dehydrogenase [Rhodococcus sp. A14]MCZ4586333.1 decarboxylating 6-phosphogluconate dehydrogenase [Rhodococcus opacus]MDI9940491.1 decarboxylating 6-phosphogluconate dehydrogenase [Rhodococcus sp. IEGM 1351]QZS59593.1 decarboxylating 6-phosphogluconate dehydrogenase [Rhodococcus opacus]RKM76361.1 6-phosphogluconate dehydrogenase (decarboxylating) [Rhodococcus opacus]
MDQRSSPRFRRRAEMQLGIVGAGRMGANIARRLLRAGHEVVIYDSDSAAVTELETEGAVAAASLQDVVSGLDQPRAVWVMVPAAVTGAVVEEVAAMMDVDDVVIDGGNSHFRESALRADTLAERGIHYLDVGTSGGVHGLDRGYCLMVGGDETAVKRVTPIFEALAPGVDAAARTLTAEGAPTAAEQGYLHCGPAGAGHFVKMVHNGIEYGQMAALAEGLAILRGANVGAARRDDDAETAPLAAAGAYRYDLDVAEITEVWRRGSVIGSWLLDLTASALRTDPELSRYSGHVSDSGEGRWVVQAAVDEGVPAHVLTAALYERFSSRGEGEYGNKALSAMRHAFGGHHEKVTTR